MLAWLLAELAQHCTPAPHLCLSQLFGGPCLALSVGSLASLAITHTYVLSMASVQPAPHRPRRARRRMQPHQREQRSLGFSATGAHCKLGMVPSLLIGAGRRASPSTWLTRGALVRRRPLQRPGAALPPHTTQPVSGADRRESRRPSAAPQRRRLSPPAQARAAAQPCPSGCGG